MILVTLLAATAALGPAGLPGGPVVTETLPNGLRLVFKEDHAKPIVAVCAMVAGGSRTEGPELKGLSHYYEHTVFRGGTAKQKELETRKRFMTLGSFGGWTWNDETTYYLVVPKENLEEALWRHADAVMNLIVDEAKIEKDRQSVIQELHMRYSDDPAGRVNYNLWATAFTTHPYGVPTIGLEEVIAKSKLPVFRTFYEERYVPNQMVLTAVGDFRIAELREKLVKLWGGYKAGKASFELGLVEPEQTAPREKIEERPVQASRVELGFKIPGMADPAQPAIDLLQALAIDLSGSRLNTALRHRKPLAIAVWGGAETHKDTSLFTVGFETRPNEESAALAGALRELKRLAEEPAPAAELARAKELVLDRFLGGNEAYEDQAITLGRTVVESDLSVLARWARDLARLTPEEVRAAAARFLVAERATVSAVRPAGSAPFEPIKLVTAAGLPPALPTAGAPAPSQPPAREALESGLTLITQRDSAIPRAVAVLAFAGGQLAEEPAQGGVAHLTARALERGTRALDPERFRARLDELGASFSSAAAPDLATLTVEAPAGHFLDALGLLADAAFRPRLEKAEIEKLKADQLAQITALEDDSFALTDREFKKALFGAAPYGRHLLGDRAGVGALGPAHVAAFHKKTYVPRNATLVVVGDVDPAAVKKRIGEAARGLPGTPAPALASAAPAALPAGGLERVAKEVRQITFDMGRLAVGVEHEDFLPLALARRVLSVRLFYKYVYEEGMAYRMWTLFPQLRGASAVYYQMGVAAENEEKARAGILAVAAELARSGLTEKEFQDAQVESVQTWVLSQARMRPWAEWIATAEARGQGLGYVLEYPERVRAVKKAQADAALARYFVGTPSERYFVGTPSDGVPMTTVIVGGK